MPVLVRLDPFICACGRRALKTENSMVYCPVCNLTWYVNHCWSCKTTVDGRYTKPCMQCSWYICTNCGACSSFECLSMSAEDYTAAFESDDDDEDEEVFPGFFDWSEYHDRIWER